MRKRSIIPAVYILFLMLPIYWLVTMSFKTTNEILGGFTPWPVNFTVDNYVKIFTDSTWYSGYINSLTFVFANTILSVVVALPAAYAFSRYRFLGDKHLFLWLLPNRMAPEGEIEHAMAARPGRPSALLMVGLGRLPEIIKTLGHDVSDRVMRTAHPTPLRMG